MTIYEPHAGMDIRQAAQVLVDGASSTGTVWSMTFNAIELTALPETVVAEVVTFYDAECQRRADAYHASPAYHAAQDAAREAEQVKRAALTEALQGAPLTMALRDPDGWQRALGANPDPYGAAVCTYAERWARLMEGALAAGEPLASCAQHLSHLADVEGITGFMYGAAVNMLAQVWVHGEALRCWHNLATQIGHEGEAANVSGGVLNPAMLMLGRGEKG